MDHSAVNDQAVDTTTSRLSRRRRVAARTRFDFWFDLTLLLGFTLAYSYGYTGDILHEWLGLALAAAMLVHLTLHWDWVVRTTKRLVSPRGHDKVIWAVNLALVLAMTLCIASGFLISRTVLPDVGLFPFGGPFWSRLHSLTAEITLVLVPVHLALRWRWLLAVGRRLLARRPGAGS
jgi:uncharacterized protein DUF4405